MSVVYYIIVSSCNYYIIADLILILVGTQCILMILKDICGIVFHVLPFGVIVLFTLSKLICNVIRDYLKRAHVT